MCQCAKNSVALQPLDDPREKKVFAIISREPASFTVIKNKACFHQEITSRVLKRLGERLIVRKTDGLYDLCCNGAKLKRGEYG